LDLFTLICYSFNNQIRFNSKGEYNMPFGKDKSSFNDSIRKNLINFRERIENVVFTSLDFRELKAEKLGEGDFVYCDPPYLITCATYNEQDGWNEQCERDLLALLDNLDERGVGFALSNVLTNKGRTNEILQEWCSKYHTVHLSNTYANCSYHAKDKTTDTTDEVLITNYRVSVDLAEPGTDKTVETTWKQEADGTMSFLESKIV
jgi:DNA adenine methylase Dam